MIYKKEIWFGVFFIVGLLSMAFFVSADYMRSDVKYTQFGSGGSFQEFDKSMCEAGQDFIIQISPFGCTPAVVRSDLLQEQNVPIFCQLGATKINPLIEVEAIDSISFTGEYPSEISGIGFHPARAALGVKGDLNSPILNNIGYVVIVLNKQSNVSSMPDFVQGNLTAKIRYDIKNAFGIGRASFHLPELSDLKWEEKYLQYGFWNGKGYLRVEGISEDKALISVYDNNHKKVSSVNLQKGETSNKIYLPGFDCLAGLQLKLDKVENPTTRAKLRVNADIVEVAEGEKFLENNCYIPKGGINKQGLTQKVEIRCREDDGVNNFDLEIRPRVILNIGGEEKIVSLGDVIHEFGENEKKKIFLGYLGETFEGEDFIVPVVSPSRNKEEFLDSVIVKALPSFIKMYTSRTGIKAIEVLKAIEIGAYGSLTIVVNAIVTGSYPLGMYAREAEGTNPSDALFDFTAVFARAVDIKLKIPEIEFIGFAGPQDEEIDDESKGYYDKAMNDYETIINSFAGEKHLEDESVTFGELALLEELKLARDAGQMRTMLELCDEFEEKYPNSRYKSELSECNDRYKLSNSESTINYVIINGKVNKISFDKIYEPSLEDYSVEIFVSNAGNYSGPKTLQKNERVFVSENEFFSLKDLENDYAIFDVINIEETIGKELTYKPQSLKIELSNYQIIGKNNYQIRVDKINLKKSAKVSVIPNIDNAGTEANFGFKIGIEKSSIQLSPEKIKSKIDNLNETIIKWQEKSDSLAKVVKGLKTACLATGTIITAKNFFANVGGKGIARQNVMGEEGGWYNRCADLVSDGTYSSQEQCMVEEADNIEEDVNDYYKEMQEQNEEIKSLQQGITEKKFLSESVVDTDEFMKRYSPVVQEYLEDNLDSNLKNPNNQDELLEMDRVISALSYDSWKDYGNYNKEQLREIELYAKLKNNPDVSPELREISEKRLYSLLSAVQEASNNYVERENFANKYGIEEVHYGSVEKLDEIKFSSDIIFNSVENHFPVNDVDYDDFVQFYKDKQTNTEYLIVLDNDYVVKQTYVIEGSVLKVKDEEKINPLKLAFKKYDSSSYENKFKSSSGDSVPIVKYYETEPYKGLPAIVPFDLNKGWYAATKQVLPVLGNIQAFDQSGRVTSFWLCNVGKNGREENIGGDDICAMINLGTGQPYNQFAGLSESEATKTIAAGVKAIEQASRQYKSGISRVNINVGYGNLNLKVGSPAVDIPDMQCQDFMSPKDCQLLFNVCDPVICPSSRCDLGGAYPVRDVIQSGIIGSIALCLPNVKEGIYIPVCLSGIQAGLDGYLSVLTSYRDCLQHSLETGEMVGVCDEIYSIHLCEFFWRQALPLADIFIPKMMEVFLGQNLRGGGEYLGVANAWSNAENSVNYLTQSYAVNSYKAFKARSVEEVGGEICKSYVSGVYPEGGNLIDSLTDPDSPPQFHGRFDEISFTSVTVPPTSHYKVFYHIFAGKDSGVYYQVYLKSPTGGSFYQDISNRRIVDSGYIGKGGYASETKDFTAPAGYTEMCINVNDQEVCGFKQVSTSFAVEYIEEKYVASQMQETDIQTEKGCISGSASAYSLLTPNIQGGVEDVINPEIYNRGIIRICASDDPGRGTDAYAGGEGARWVEVGYCGDKKIKCWLDTQSVSDIIKNTDIEEDVLETVTENQLDILRNKEGYISPEEFLSEIEEIDKEDNLQIKISLINQVFDQVFLNSEKAYLFFLRGDAYSELVVGKYIEVKETEKEEAEERDEEQEEEEVEEEIKVEEDKPELSDIKLVQVKCEEELTPGCEIWEKAKVLADSSYDHFRLVNGEKVYTDVCASFVSMILDSIGVNIECSGIFIPHLLSEFEQRNDFVEIYRNELETGDLVILGKKTFFSANTKNAQHMAIFSHYDKTNKDILWVYDDSDKVIVELRSYSADPNDGPWYFYRAFRYLKDLEYSRDRSLWTIDSALTEIDNLIRHYNSGKITYSSNDDIKKLINELCEDEILSSTDCKFVETEHKEEGFRTRFKTDEKNIESLKQILIIKQI